MQLCGSCLFVACFDPGAFRPDDLFAESVERVASRLKAVKPADGFAGEAEKDTRWRLLINTNVEGDL
jgi:LDH2 family malate/lactate/ureidoglycolate dehydrogenase